MDCQVVGILFCLLVLTVVHAEQEYSGQSGNKTTRSRAAENALQVFGPALIPRDYANRRNNHAPPYGKSTGQNVTHPQSNDNLRGRNHIYPNITGPEKTGKDTAQSEKKESRLVKDQPISSNIQHVHQVNGESHHGHGNDIHSHNANSHGHAHNGQGNAHHTHEHAHHGQVHTHPHSHGHHGHGHGHHGHDHGHHGHGDGHHGHGHHSHGHGHHGRGKRRGRFYVCKTKEADSTEKTREDVDCINKCKLLPALHQPLNGTKISACRAKRRPSNSTIKPNRYLHKWPVICDIKVNGTTPNKFKPKPSCSSGQTCKVAPHQPLSPKGVSISICYYGDTIVYHHHNGRCYRYRRYRFNRRGRGRGKRRGRYRYRCPGMMKKKAGRMRKRKCPAFWSVRCVWRLIKNN